MGYEHIIEARKRLQALSVPHLWDGGDVAKGALGVATGGISELVPGLSNFNGGQGPLGGNLMNKAGLQNNYQAQAPDIQKSDFQHPMDSGYFDYKNSQAGLGNQYSDLRGLSGQQRDTTAGIGKEAGAVSGLAGSQGLGGVLSQQQSLAQALQAQANGQGPNPAQDQFKQNVNQAIAQNAGMVASQKGINPALAARMAGQNAASMTQGAASNEAQLQAQQQLAAQQELGQNLAQQGNTVMGQGQLHSTAGGLIGQQVGAQGAAGQTMMGAGQLAGTMGSLANGMYGNAVSGQTAQNNTGVNASLGAQQINSGVAAGNVQARGQVLGGVLNAGGAIGAAALAHGGEVGVDGKAMSLAQALMARGGQVPGQPQHPGDDYRNDVVPTVLSKGEVVLPNSVTQGDDAPAKAAEFVEHLKAKAHPGYGKVLEARRKHQEALEAFHQGGCA